MSHNLTDNEYQVITNILNGIIDMAKSGHMFPEPALAAIQDDAESAIEILKDGIKEEV